MKQAFINVLLVYLMFSTSRELLWAQEKKVPAISIEGKKLDMLKLAAHTALKSDPDEADVVLEIHDDRLHYNFDRLGLLFKPFDRRDELKHLAVIEAIKLRYPELRKIWEPKLQDLDRRVQAQLQISKTKEHEKQYIEADKRSSAALSDLLQTVAKAKGAKNGAVATDGDPKFLTFKVRVVTDPPGGRRFYSTAFKFALMKNLDMAEQAWQEALTDTMDLGGKYYFKAQWPNEPSKQFGPQEITNANTITLTR